jgi:osmotically inducible lipoprotein OsmB
MKKKIAVMMVAVLPLAGCGNNPMDRALSGAGIGAGAGAVTGVLVGGSVGGAMLVGAAAGAVTGAVTDKSRINFGDPIWR